METTEQNQSEHVEAPADPSEGAEKDEPARADAVDAENAERPAEEVIIHNVPYSQPSIEENVRRSGLAWSAGIVFFTSIAFMLFLGWIADILLGSTPWGLVGGIVLGAIIGFIQFFRISSQIFATPQEHGSSKTLFKEDDKNT